LPPAGQSEQLQQDAANRAPGAEGARLVQRGQFVQPSEDAGEVRSVEVEVDVLLKEKRRQFRLAGDGDFFEVQRFHIEFRPEKALVEIDDGVAGAGRVRNHVHPIRQHEAHMARAEGPHRTADHLLRSALDAHLNLKVLMPVRSREDVAGAFETDVEVEVVRTLLHAVEAEAGMAGRCRHRSILRLCGLRPCSA